MSSLSNLFTANRVAAISTWLVALAALIASFVGVFPASWQNAVVAAIALLTKAATTVKFLDGSQKWDALTNKAPESAAGVTTMPGEASNPTHDYDLENDPVLAAIQDQVQADPPPPPVLPAPAAPEVAS